MSRSRSTSSISSQGLLSFGSVRLNDLIVKYDEYALDTSDLIDEEAVEATMPDVHVIPAGGEDSDEESASPEKASLGSNDSKEQSVIGVLIDKAKSKGRKLVSKKDKSKSPDFVEDVQQKLLQHSLHCQQEALSLSAVSSSSLEVPLKKASVSNILNPHFGYSLAQKCRNMPFFQHRMILLGVLIAVTVAVPGFTTGLLWGFYVSFIGFLYFFVSEPKPKDGNANQDDHDYEEVEMGNEANSSFDGKGLGIGDGITYKGWMNELKCRYSPVTYHVNHAQSVLVRLEGTTLRISRPAKTVLKHAFHEDPTLKQAQPSMVSQTIYDLCDARVSLRPKRLAARRWWSRKYPIHIRFANKSSALAEIDLSKAGMSRSVSLHPVGSAADGLPILSEIPKAYVDDPGYSAESETSGDETCSSHEVHRSNSTGDLAEFEVKSHGLSRKKKGRSIYLFARGAREKERWFHLLREACAKTKMLHTGKMKRSTSCEATTVYAMEAEVEKEAEKPRKIRVIDPTTEYIYYQKNHVQFAKQLYDIMSKAVSTPEHGSIVSVDLGTMKWHPGKPEENSDLVESINALATRIFFDFTRDQFWISAVKQKIQSKLATIHLPYFIETLELSELDLGIVAPTITGVYSPKMDEWGLWVDFDMKYQGGIRLTLQTSVNLMKLKSGMHTVETEKEVTRFTTSVRAARYSDDDVPESPESSPDEDFGSKVAGDQVKERRSKKILNFVERAAQSTLFQKASKIAPVAKFMENFSSTPLILNVEISMFEGTMTINIPPPPSDRLWYAFRHAPEMSVKAVPQVGDRSVDVTTVSEWIESKLKLLIEKNLVCPNMDDIILPVMSGNSLLQMGYNR